MKRPKNIYVYLDVLYGNNLLKLLSCNLDEVNELVVNIFVKLDSEKFLNV